MRKRLLFAFVTLILFCANAYGFAIGNLKYEITSDHEVSVACNRDKEYDTELEELIIPASVTYDNQEYLVTSIQDEGFSYCRALESIVFPNSLKSIGHGAFKGCYNLTSLRISDSVTTIGNEAFSGLGALTELVIGNSVETIGDGAFKGCYNLTSLCIPDSVTTIGNEAFYTSRKDYKNLVSELTIGNSVQTIGDSAFKDFCNLTSLRIPDSVITIGNEAFAGLSALTELVIGSSVEIISDRAFYGCYGLTSLRIPDSVKTIGMDAFETGTYWNLISLIIGNSVETIKAGNFSRCENLTSLVIPNSVKTIGSGTFSELTSLTELTIGDSVETIGELVFSRCSSLTNITLPESVTEIGRYAFSDCMHLESIQFNSVNCVFSKDAFKNVLESFYPDLASSYPQYSKLILGPKVQICPETLTTLPDSQLVTLEFSQDLKEFEYFPSTVTEIRINVDDIDKWVENTPVNYQPSNSSNVTIFYKTNPISTVNIGNGVTRIAPYAFANSEIKSILFPSTLNEVGKGALQNTDITNLSLPEGLKVIDDNAFYNCELLSEVTLSSTLQEIGESAFEGDISLYNIEIPSGVNEIKDNAFKGCIDLETVVFNNGLKTIGNWSFAECPRLSLPSFPNSLEEIGDNAFYRSASENVFTGELKFGDKLKSIGSNAFGRVVELIRHQYDDLSVYSTEYSNPEGLLTVWFPNSLKTLGNQAFYGQPIREVKLPEGLENFGPGVFSCTNIMELSFPGSLKSLPDSVCSDMNKLNRVYIGEGITSLGSYAFSNTTISHLSLPSGLTEIGTQAFVNTKLTQCDIPASVTTIGDYAFFNSGLINCYIPNEVTSLGEKVFSDINRVTLGTGISSLDKQIATNVSVLEILSATPPALTVNRLGFTPDLVLVPENSRDNYINNNRWKDYNISAYNSYKAVVHVSEPGTMATEIRKQTGIVPALVTNLIVDGSLNDDDFAVMRTNMTSCYDIDLSGITNMSLPDNAFSNKRTLLTMTLPSNLTSIGESAFKGCSSLQISNIPASLETIGNSGFYGCESMSGELVFPKSLKEIGEKAFSFCRSLRSVDFSAAPYLNFIDSNSDEDSNNEYNGIFEYCSSMEEVILPEYLQSIPSRMFANTGISGIAIPPYVERIGIAAFKGSDLQKISLPGGLKEIEEEAFATTHYMAQTQIPNKVEYIGTRAFNESGIPGIVLPGSLKELGSAAFKGSALSFVSFYDGLTEIPTEAFADCPFLTFVNLPSTLTYIGDDSFGTTSLAAISSPSINPADTGVDPFNGVNNYECALSIPTNSYSKYLQAEYWGAFVGIRDCIDVTIPDAIEASYMSERDYQDMLMEKDNLNQPSDIRHRALRALARANDDGTGYGRLFNGASLYLADNSIIRVFLNIPEGIKDVIVEYDGRDITNEIDPQTMSFVTPALTSSSSLVIKSESLTKVTTLTTNSIDATTPIYSLTGVVVGYGLDALNNLPKGIYVIAGKKIAIK